MDALIQALQNCGNLHAGMLSNLMLAGIFVPVFMGLILIITDKLTVSTGKLIAGAGFSFVGLVSVFVWAVYTATYTDGGYLFRKEWDTGLTANTIGIKLILGVNGISAPMLLLTGIAGFAAGIYAMRQQMSKPSLYLGLMLVMLGGLVGVFTSMDIFFYYFFHELALIPTFIAMGYFGGRAARQSALEMAIYLTLGAMLSLAGLIFLAVKASANPEIARSFDIQTLQLYFTQAPLAEQLQQNVFAILLIGLGILVSLFPFYSWAPRLYATAPAGISMLHAGVLKKFGLYGLVQIAMPLLPEGMAHWSDVLVWLALANVVVIGLICLAQTNLKELVGYGSVMHMGYLFLGLATMGATGIGGATILMVGHGLSVALLILLADMVEEKTGTAQISAIGGLSQKAPLLAGFFVAAVMGTAGLPGFATFVGELTIFSALFAYNPWVAAGAMLGIVITAIYGLRAAARVFFGEHRMPAEHEQDRVPTGPIGDISFSARVPVVVLLAALLILGVCPSLISNSINEAVTRLYPEVPIPNAIVQADAASAQR